MENATETMTAQVAFPVVGIGASASGLEAVTTMFHKIKSGLRMAYVLVMHLDPNHESLSVELMSRKTQVGVRQIKDGDAIEADVSMSSRPALVCRSRARASNWASSQSPVVCGARSIFSSGLLPKRKGRQRPA